MTRKVGNKVFIEPTPDAKCELCGKIDELRPYGPKGENICFDCGMKNEEATSAAFDALVDGPGEKPQ